jgi:hypothetical protein
MSFLKQVPVDVYPLLLAVTTACSMGVYLGYHNLRTHNDVVVNKHNPYQYQTDGSPKVIDIFAPKDKKPRSGHV